MTDSRLAPAKVQWLRRGTTVAAVVLLAACSQGSKDAVPTTTSEPASTTTTTVVDTALEKLSATIISHYSTSGSAHLRSIMTESKAACMATEYLKIRGYRALIEQSPGAIDFEKLVAPTDEAIREEVMKPFWRCVTVPDIVQEVYGENGDCCRDIYPESTLSCLRTEFAKMEREVLVTELVHYSLGQPLGADYAATVTACGISLPE